MLTIGICFLLLFFYPIFKLFLIGTPLALLAGQLSLALIFSIFVGPLAITTAESFPTTTRYIGTSTGIISATIFGGTCPLVATYLVQLTGNLIILCLYPIGFALICLVNLYSERIFLFLPF